MKKHYIIGGLSVLTILATAAGSIGMVQAASNTNTGLGRFSQGMMCGKDKELKQNLTEAQITELNTKMKAIQTALDAGNYTDWVTAVTALNAQSPLLKKINSTNFSKYVEANNLHKQIQVIYKDLGIERGKGFGSGNMQNGAHLGRIAK